MGLGMVCKVSDPGWLDLSAEILLFVHQIKKHKEKGKLTSDKNATAG